LVVTCFVFIRIRSDVWEQEGTLLEYWSKGMIAVGSSEQKLLVTECGLLTGLSYTQIKVNHVLPSHN